MNVTLDPNAPATEISSLEDFPDTVLVYCRVPDEHLDDLYECGVTEDDRIGIKMLAEIIQLRTGLPAAQLLPAGWLLDGLILIQCDPLPPAQVIAGALEVLARYMLADYFSIFLWDTDEQIYRAVHHGRLSGNSGNLTIEHVANEAAEYRRFWEARLKKQPPPVP